MDMFILRHGKAEQSGDGPDDMNRKLTAEGREEIRNVARWMRQKMYRFDVIATSPLARATETAEIVAKVLKERNRLEVWDELQPMGDMETVSYHAAQCGSDATVILVGHEPDLTRLIGGIITGGNSANLVLAKGGLAKIRNFSFEKKPYGELQWLLTPRQMIKML